MRNKAIGMAIWLAALAGLARADDTGGTSPATAAGQFTNPTNVFSDNGAYAVEGTVGDTMACWDFSFNVPADAAAINGILVEADSRCTGSGCDVGVDFRLSWNGGVNWTAAQQINPSTESYYPMGGATDTWGRAWAAADFANANFRCGIKYSSELNGTDAVNIDHVRITVFYTPASGVGSPRRKRLFEK